MRMLLIHKATAQLLLYGAAVPPCSLMSMPQAAAAVSRCRHAYASRRFRHMLPDRRVMP